MEKMNTSHKGKETKSLKDFINMIRNNLVAMYLIVGISLILSIVYAIYARDIYKSTTTLKISKPSGSILKSPLLPEFQDL
jgi:uncharacterized protein involved in exopolysaccharide biosynthesis